MTFRLYRAIAISRRFISVKKTREALASPPVKPKAIYNKNDKELFQKALLERNFALAKNEIINVKPTFYELDKFIQLGLSDIRNNPNSAHLRFIEGLIKENEIVELEYFYKLLIGYTKLQDTMHLQSLVNYMMEKDILLQEGIVEVILKHYADNHQTAMINDVLDYLREVHASTGNQGHEPFPIHFYKYLIKSEKNPFNNLSLLSKFKTKSPIIVNQILREFANHGSVTGMKTMQPFIQKDQETFNILLHGYKNAKQYEKALSLHMEMIELDISPNHQTMSILIDMYCKSGQVDRAFNIIKEMVTNGEQPLVIYCNSILDQYRKHKQFDKCLEVYDLIKLTGQPDSTTLNIMMCMYGFDKQYTKAAEYFAKVKQDKFNIGTMISIALYNEEHSDVDEYYKLLKKHGMLPNSKIIHSMIQKSIKINDGYDFYYQLGKDLGLVDAKILNLMREVKGKEWYDEESKLIN
ncbi:hypothetical protein HDV06_002965 [Boothiomyces sp. JEL0866]|nr:hypothetical protein HDV06_002965 [Boothiomyces sp. JEL0866]